MRRIISVLFAVLFFVVLAMLVASGPTASAGTKLAGSDATRSGDGKASAPEPPSTPTIIPTPTRTPVPFPTGSPVCASTWNRIDTPNVGIDYNTLRSIDGIGPNDLWAVGYYLSDSLSGTKYKRAPISKEQPSELERGVDDLNRQSEVSSAFRTMIQHWNGTEWSVVTSPNVGTNDNTLLSVTVLSVNDAWAVGYYYNDFGIAQTLALHWNGTAWTQSATPSVSPYQDSELQSVQAAGPDDVWAVGYSRDEFGFSHALALHWDGTEWAIYSTPEPTGEYMSTMLEDLAVIATDDIWAGGYYVDQSVNYSVQHTLALHWDGTQWSIVVTPNIGSNSNAYYALDAAGPDDVWAVGAYNDSSYGTRPLAQHWNGTDWSFVLVPTTGEVSLLYGIDVFASDDVWAVGNPGSPYAPYGSFSAHWDGQAWTPLDATDYSFSTFTNMSGVKVVAPGDVWAVGTANSGSYYGTQQTLAAHYGDLRTSCDKAFADVPEGSTFYEAIHYLTCRTVFGGYPCGGVGEPCNSNEDPYFRPSASITRGQLSKIVSNAAGFDDDPGGPMFADVNYYDTYFVYIARLAERGIVSGYDCGSTPSEPCYPPYTVMYFRPGATATRGQIAKIVAEAKGYTNELTTQHFQDVPPTSTYYKWVENLATVEAMSGYPCGGANEPCVGPENRPYFRPGDNATRGQTARIVTAVFYPGCDTGR